MTPEEKAVELWAEVTRTDGPFISATFPTQEAAGLFVQWLEQNDYSHAGISGPHHSQTYWENLKKTGVDSGERAWTVRYR